jgi:hypothetical protein
MYNYGTLPKLPFEKLRATPDNRFERLTLDLTGRCSNQTELIRQNSRELSLHTGIRLSFIFTFFIGNKELPLHTG